MLWLGLGQLPRNAGATGTEMANSFRPMPGDRPVKQSKNPRLLRLKKNMNAILSERFVKTLRRVSSAGWERRLWGMLSCAQQIAVASTLLTLGC